MIQDHLLKRLFHPLPYRANFAINHGSVYGRVCFLTLFCSSGLFVSPCTKSHGLNCFSSIMGLDIWQCPSALCFFKIFMDVTGLCIFHINFIVTLRIFTMTEISSNLCIDLERNSFFKISSLPVYE